MTIGVLNTAWFLALACLSEHSPEASATLEEAPGTTVQITGKSIGPVIRLLYDIESNYSNVCAQDDVSEGERTLASARALWAARNYEFLVDEMPRIGGFEEHEITNNQDLLSFNAARAYLKALECAPGNKEYATRALSLLKDQVRRLDEDLISCVSVEPLAGDDAEAGEPEDPVVTLYRRACLAERELPDPEPPTHGETPKPPPRPPPKPLPEPPRSRSVFLRWDGGGFLAVGTTSDLQPSVFTRLSTGVRLEFGDRKKTRADARAVRRNLALIGGYYDYLTTETDGLRTSRNAAGFHVEYQRLIHPDWFALGPMLSFGPAFIVEDSRPTVVRGGVEFNIGAGIVLLKQSVNVNVRFLYLDGFEASKSSGFQIGIALNIIRAGEAIAETWRSRNRDR